MKILKLRFKNLNSLAGEWEIDFASQEYITNGIFAITGSTGAGKTTILDAICLALYGKTPRISNISTSSNEIMSRQTGECFAELTYETINGVYKNFWGQGRARKKSDGKLQNATYEISDVKTEKILATKIREVKQKTEEITGMDFEQFTRSMLLAQGSFAAFLKASPDEKASILEQITGSEIYSDISKTVHEQRGNQKNELDLLESKLSTFKLLSDEEKEVLNLSLQENQNKEKNLSEKNKKNSEAINWLDNKESLIKELKQINLDIEVLKEKQEEFSDNKKRLELANYAKELELEYDKLLTKRKELIDNKNILAKNNQTIKVLEKLMKESSVKLNSATSAFKKAKEEEEKERLIIKDVRELDLQITTKKEDNAKFQKEIDDIAKQIKNYIKFDDKNKKTKDKVELEIKSLNEYVEKNSIDEKLVNDLSGIIEKLRGLEILNQDKLDLENKLKTLQKEKSEAETKDLKNKKQVDEIKKSLSKLENKKTEFTEDLNKVLGDNSIEDLRINHSNLKDELILLEKIKEIVSNIEINNKKLIETNSEKENAESAKEKNKSQLTESYKQEKEIEDNIKVLNENLILLNKIKSLEDYRDELQDGKECPLCGALEHPFAKGNLPQANDAKTQLLDKQKLFKTVSISIKKLERDVTKNEAEIEYSDKEILRLNNENKSLLLDRDKISKQIKLDSNNLSIEALKNKIDDNLKNTNDISDNISNAEKIVKKLEKQTAELAKKNEQENELSKQVLAEEIRLKNLKKEFGSLNEKSKQSLNIYKKNETEILKTIAQFGIESLKNAEKQLTIKKNEWLKNKDEKDKLEVSLLKIKSEINSNQLLLNSQDGNKKKIEKSQNINRDNLVSLTEKRIDLYSEKNPDTEEKRIKNLIDKQEKVIEKEKVNNNKASNDFNNLGKQISDLTEKNKLDDENINIKESDFKKSLSKSLFDDEKSFISARLAKKERDNLEKEKEHLRTSQTQLNTSLKNSSDKLKELDKQNLTEDNIDNLRNSQTELNSELKELNEITGALNQKLKIDNDNRSNQSDILKDKEYQNKEFIRWQKLHDLIGSGDGKKYRSFAQGLTFEVMIQYANKQLGKMSNRYLLTRNLNSPLELNVYDNYQAGEIRSTSNLSGGESFIVSLALALGLSQMASHKIKVDSLFLDEGFGTLDEDALSVALDTLSNLKQSGKLIGIISHISSLKERISSQIEVTSQNNGTSIISGPGITKK